MSKRKPSCHWYRAVKLPGLKFLKKLKTMFTASPAWSSPAPPPINPRKQAHLDAEESYIARVPDDVLENVLLDKLVAEDLCRLAQVSARFRQLTSCEARWKELFVERWGQPTVLTERAYKIAGKWRLLYSSKHTNEKVSAPWRKPCDYEAKAALQQLTLPKMSSPDNELAVVFLVDGSGSVAEEDFSTMVNFIRAATSALQDAAPDSKVGVVQFSNEVKVEVPPQVVNEETFHQTMNDMVRMNGGTNIAVAIQKAGQLLKKHCHEDAIRTVVLLTDGRVDKHQAHEAVCMVERLADEQRNVSLFAFGVGRGVDRVELENIIAGAAIAEQHSACYVKGGPQDVMRYIELCVRDDPPW